MQASQEHGFLSLVNKPLEEQSVLLIILRGIDDRI